MILMSGIHRMCGRLWYSVLGKTCGTGLECFNLFCAKPTLQGFKDSLMIVSRKWACFNRKGVPGGPEYYMFGPRFVLESRCVVWNSVV